MANEDYQIAGVLMTGLGAIFQGIIALQGLPRATLTVAHMKQPIRCPNCNQVFDAADFPFEDGVKKVTCPRCYLTWAI